jgi:hypothetical protein
MTPFLEQTRRTSIALQKEAKTHCVAPMGRFLALPAMPGLP